MQGSWETSRKGGREGPKALKEEQPEGMVSFLKARWDHSLPYLLNPCYKIFLNIKKSRELCNAQLYIHHPDSTVSTILTLSLCLYLAEINQTPDIMTFYP